MVEDLGFPTATSVLHSLNRHGKVQHRRSLVDLYKCDIYSYSCLTQTGTQTQLETTLNYI